MAALEAALEQATAGNAQVVGVVASRETGKSSLCYEFVQRCRTQGIPIYEGHGASHGKAIPLLPILEFFRSSFGITEHDMAQAARDKIAGRMVLLDAGSSPTGYRSSPISSEFRTPSDPPQLSVPRRGSASSSM